MLEKVKEALKATARGTLKASRRVDGRYSPLRRKREMAPGSLGTSGNTAANHELIS